MAVLYDGIGRGYAGRRREDPRLKAGILRALGSARSVVNVGAGAGSYEPGDRAVIAVEPSAVMVGQRRSGHAVVRGMAQALPLRDGAVDGAMTVLSLHHWVPHQERGVREMCRVARGPVVIVTIDAEVSGRMWLMADYLHEVRDLDHRIFPPPERVASWLSRDREVQLEVVPVARETPDHTLLSFWAHPERVLDRDARAATSGFARQPPEVVERVVAAVEADLASGRWDERHGHLRALDQYDAGLRLLVASAPR